MEKHTNVCVPCYTLELVKIITNTASPSHDGDSFLKNNMERRKHEGQRKREPPTTEKTQLYSDLEHGVDMI